MFVIAVLSVCLYRQASIRTLVLDSHGVRCRLVFDKIPGAVHLSIDLTRCRFGQPRLRSRPDIGENKLGGLQCLSPPKLFVLQSCSLSFNRFRLLRNQLRPSRLHPPLASIATAPTARVHRDCITTRAHRDCITARVHRDCITARVHRDCTTARVTVPAVYAAAKAGPLLIRIFTPRLSDCAF